MSDETSNMDDLLTHGFKQNVSRETIQDVDNVSRETITDTDGVIDVHDNEDIKKDNEENKDYGNRNNEEEQEESEEKEHLENNEQDDYGNKKQQDNEVIRDRLARQAESMKRQHQAELDALRAQLVANQSPAVEKASEGFQYNEESNQTWDQQLRAFVENTVSSMNQRQQTAAQQAREQQAQSEFQTKFHTGMSNFPDFIEVLSEQPVSDHMVLATRGMKDPAAFLYAASKRAPQELQRISKINDPYMQIAEMGRLEATLRQTKAGTTAPKPIHRTKEDGNISYKNSKELTIEQQIALSEKRKLAAMKLRHR